MKLPNLSSSVCYSKKIEYHFGIIKQEPFRLLINVIPLVHFRYLKYIPKEPWINIASNSTILNIDKNILRNTFSNKKFVGKGHPLIFNFFPYVTKINNFLHSNDRAVGRLFEILTTLSVHVLEIPIEFKIAKFLINFVL